MRLCLSIGLTLFIASVAIAADLATPRPVPLTRPEMKRALEDMKSRTPRIPLPELTEADKEKLGDRADNYEARLRYHYLPDGQTSSSFSGRGGGNSFGIGRGNDPDMTLDYAFTVELFWIAARTNNCQYCLGHQESKLLVAGRSEDQIASLDGDWLEHTPAERAAYAFARKLTHEPHRIGDADIDGLRAHYNDKQILEMILFVAGYNSINRWKEGAGIPQSANGGNFGNRRPDGSSVPAPAEKSDTAKPHNYLTPTSPKFQNVVTKVVPLLTDEKTGKASSQTAFRRAALESRADVEKALAAASQRTPRLPLVDEAKARELVPEGFAAGDLPKWVRLIATFPTSGKGRIASIHAAETRGDLTPLLKAQVSWIIARQDRAWYALGQARRRLKELGWSDDQIVKLDGDWSEFTLAEQAQFRLARQLAASPIMLTDVETTAAVKQVGPRDVTQLISYTTNRASFNRITEAAGLRIEQ